VVFSWFFVLVVLNNDASSAKVDRQWCWPC
jgi:hypothetical protein